jgi:hypothetical protein
MPVLNSTYGTNTTLESLIVYNQSTKNATKNIINWKVNNTPVMVLNMPFEGSGAITSTKDYSTNGNNGTVTNATFSSTGGYDGNGAYMFDGMGDYITIADQDSLSPLGKGNMSISVWVNMNKVVQSGYIVYKGQDPFNQFEYSILVENNRIKGVIWQPRGIVICQSQTANDILTNTWYHVVFVANSGTNCSIYLNGVLKSTSIGVNWDKYANTPSTLEIGGRDSGIFDGNTFFNGTIDDVAILNRSLSAEQISLLYQGRNDAIYYGEIRAGQRWQACITPINGIADGEEKCSNNLTVTVSTPSKSNSSIWIPKPGTTWQINFQDSLFNEIGVDVYDLDLFDTPDETVASFHANGKKVICYLSAGSYENWRPDSNQFPSIVLGNDYSGWNGEKWLDIRRIDLIGPIMQKRMDLCKQKGFDGIDPDNIDSYTTDTGFSLTYNDQLVYNKWLAQEAHKRNLSIGLKNNPDQIADLLPYFEWMLTEECFNQGWCNQATPFITAGKAVFAIEYTDTKIKPAQFCPQAKALNISVAYKKRNLDSWIYMCP